MKKLLTIAVALALIVCLFALGSLNASAVFTEGDYQFTIDDHEVTIVYYVGSASKISIPATLGGYPVTAIGAQAFWGCSSLTEIVIHNNVKSIGDHAFYRCDSLTSVTIGASVTSIGDYAFFGCSSLRTLNIPNSVTSVGKNMLSYCTSLTKVILGNSVDTIEESMFSYCVSLTEVVIPSSVTTIGHLAFESCSALTTITIPDSVTSIGICAFDGCSSLTSVIIPNSVTTIGEYAFAWCESLTSVTMGNSITTIDECTFSYCTSLISVTIPDGVTTIGVSAFDWCESLTDVYYSGSKTDRTNISISSNNENLMNATWHYKNPTSISITSQPKSVCVANGAKATVKVTAVGDGLTYKWYFKDTGASKYTYTSSFKGNTYSITMTDARAGRRVLCKVYDKYGNMVQTKSALLSQAVRITKQPANVCVANGKTATVKVEAKGEGLTYKWYFKDAGASSYKLTTSFTGNTYSITMTDARAGRRVLCKVYDKYGNSVQSKSVLLSQSVRITKQPVSVTVSEGSTAKVTVKAVGDGLTYKWYFKDAGASSYKYTSSFKGNTYSVSMTDARAGRRVLCIVYDKYGNKVQSNTVILKMK